MPQHHGEAFVFVVALAFELPGFGWHLCIGGFVFAGIISRICGKPLSVQLFEYWSPSRRGLRGRIGIRDSRGVINYHS